MRLEHQHVAVFVAEGFEDLEFWVTVMRLRGEALVGHSGRPAR